MSNNDYTVLSAQGNELYAYITINSASKDWPLEIEYEGSVFQFEAWWALPTKMGAGWVQAARYIKGGTT